MEIIKAEVLGACFGVERALNILDEQYFENNGEQPLYTYGHLVHNKQILKEIEDKGVGCLLEPNAEPGILVVRAHSIDIHRYKEFASAGFTIIDATCPIVKKNFLSMSEETNPILYIGEKEHSETEGYKNSVTQPFFIVDSVNSVAFLDKSKKYSVYFQTTFGTILGNEIKAEIEKQNLNVVYKSSICRASIDRRAAVDKLAKAVKVIVVIGDKTSSNSKTLLLRAENNNCKGYLVEDEKDVENFPYKDEEVIGLTAAASVTKEMINKFEELFKAL